MTRCALILVTLLALLFSLPLARAGGDKGKISGILIDVRLDDKSRTLTVRADGDEEPTKFTMPLKLDAKMTAMIKGVFTCQRIQISYQTNGDERQVTNLVRLPTTANGAFAGTVIAVHDNFWVEVKPAKGPPEGFAAMFSKTNQDVVNVLKTLQKGDRVTLRYTTDIERHRIISIQKVSK